MRNLVILLIILSAIMVHAQEDKNWQFSGYVSALASAKIEKSDSMFYPSGENKHKDGLLHNRLNFFWYPAGNMTFSAQMRNRLIWDETFSESELYADNIENDMGWMQLSHNFYAKNDLVFNSNIDRLYFQYTKGNLDVSIGRQRINWSQTFAWNPNDIFNASNYFDFDYAEKPGSDALRLQYYTGMASSAEVILKMDTKKNLTFAGLYRTNIKSYDFQVLSGIMNEEEFVLGAGWSGYLYGAGFRGEITSILPYRDSSEYMHSMDNLVMTSISFDYSFTNSAYLMAEFLYSNNDVENLSASLTSVFSSPMTVRNLAFARFSSLLSASYPVHPLVNASLSGMYFYKINGFYAGPNMDFSITNDLNLSLYWQYFRMYLSKENIPMMSDIAINYLFFRLKYNF